MPAGDVEEYFAWAARGVPRRVRHGRPTPPGRARAWLAGGGVGRPQEEAGAVSKCASGFRCVSKLPVAGCQRESLAANHQPIAAHHASRQPQDRRPRVQSRWHGGPAPRFGNASRRADNGGETGNRRVGEVAREALRAAVWVTGPAPGTPGQPPRAPGCRGVAVCSPAHGPAPPRRPDPGTSPGSGGSDAQQPPSRAR